MSQVQWGDVAAWVSGLGTMGAVGFAAAQVRLLRQDAKAQQRVELDGVVVSWKVLNTPIRPDVDGRSLSVYSFVAHNPGRLPITEVEVLFSADTDMTRVYDDGRREPPAREIWLDTPVIAAQSVREWRRQIEIDFSEAHHLRKARARISFNSLVDGQRKVNVWGRT